MAESIPVLTFHAWAEPASPVSFPPRVFDRGLRKLHERGFRTLRLEEVVELVLSGAGFPSRSFVLTIDDGYSSVYEYAFAVLQKYGMTATLFLTVGTERPNPAGALPNLDGRAMLHWEQVREMQRYGFEIGAHTLTHSNLRRLSTSEIEAEMRDSKAVIEDLLGAPVGGFSYPFGRFDDRSQELARKHFAYACSDRLGLVTAESDPHVLERIDAYYLRTERRFDRLLEPWFPLYLRLQNIPRRIRRGLLGEP